MQKVIVIPGLGDHANYAKAATRNWSRVELQPIIFPLNWYNKENFETKLQDLCSLADKLSRDGSEISVVGCSAGGSAAINLFMERTNVLKNAVSICGRLKMGNQNGFRSFETRTKASFSFAQSVKLFESREKYLMENQREKIMTIHPQFGDELVPADTAVLEGACNIIIPTLEHCFSIYMALSLFSKPLISFLKN